MKIALLILLIAVVSTAIIIFWPQEKITVETINLPSSPITKPNQIKEIKEELIRGGIEEAATTQEEVLEEIPINLQSIVALRCIYINPDTGDKRTVFGSGAIVSEDGSILTARHMVDAKYIYKASNGKQGFYGYQLSHCDVGFPKETATTPTVQQIRSINPFIIIDFLPYVAKIDFLPDTSALSPAEESLFDVALLKITDLSEDAKIFGITKIPDSFAYNTLLGNGLPEEGEEVITFGFPSGIPDYGSYFRLQGSVGHIKRILGGDQFFRNKPVEIERLMETIGGRSGSPLFWKGYVIGVVSFKEDNSINAFATSIIPLVEVLPE